MPFVKISQLPVGTTPSGSELIESVQSGESVQFTLAQVVASLVAVSYQPLSSNLTVLAGNDGSDLVVGGNALSLYFTSNGIQPFFINGTALIHSDIGAIVQGQLTLTTTGSSGAATLTGTTLNIPQYANTTYSNGTGLTLTGTTFSVNTSQSISTLSNLTSNGLIKTSGGTGILSIAISGIDYQAPISFGTGVQSALTIALNTSSGLPSLDSNSMLNKNQLLGLPLRVANVGALNIVGVGDSITVGSGASILPVTSNAVPNGQTSVAVINGTNWISSLRQMGFFKNGATVFNLGQGSQKIAEGLSQYTHSPGISVTATLTNNSPSGTITNPGIAGYIQSGTVVTATGIPANTTASMTTVSTACSITTDSSSNSSTITVTGSTAGLANGMFVLSNNSGIANGNVNIPAGTTITISGSTITLSTPLSVWQIFSKTVPCTLYFISPTITLSNAFTGTTGSLVINFGGTLITSSGTFTSGSTSVTGVTTTGSSVGLISNMGIGSMFTAPGTSFTISGTTITLSRPATATSSGAGTFYASTPTYNVESATNTYGEQGNTTPHLLSPAVTGIPGVFLNFYGVNDAGNGGNLTNFETNYLALNALARADGYTVINMTQVPLTSTASFGYGSNTALQDSMTTWTRAQAYPGVASGWNYLIDIAAAFPQGHAATDIYHISDGIHPNDLGHQLIAGTINDAFFKNLASSSSLLAYPFTNGGINENWLPSTAVLTDKANTFGTVTSGSTQTVFGSVIAQGNQANGGVATLGAYNYVNSEAEVDFGYTDSSGTILTKAWSALYNASGGTFNISNVAGTSYLFFDGTNTTLAAPGTTFFRSQNIFLGWQGGSNYNAEIFSGFNFSYLDLVAYTVTPAHWTMVNDFSGFTLRAGAAAVGTTYYTFTTSSLTLNAGSLVLGASGKTVSLKGGTNAASGTVTLTAGSGTISSTAITTSSVIILTLVTASGTNSHPQITAGSGSATITGLATDAGTYNWAMILANQ